MECIMDLTECIIHNEVYVRHKLENARVIYFDCILFSYLLNCLEDKKYGKELHDLIKQSSSEFGKQYVIDSLELNTQRLQKELKKPILRKYWDMYKNRFWYEIVQDYSIENQTMRIIAELTKSFNDVESKKVSELLDKINKRHGFGDGFENLAMCPFEKVYYPKDGNAMHFESSVE